MQLEQSAPVGGSYLEGTLAQIVTLANEDVEMKVRTPQTLLPYVHEDIWLNKLCMFAALLLPVLPLLLVLHPDSTFAFASNAFSDAFALASALALHLPLSTPGNRRNQLQLRRVPRRGHQHPASPLRGAHAVCGGYRTPWLPGHRDHPECGCVGARWVRTVSLTLGLWPVLAIALVFLL